AGEKMKLLLAFPTQDEPHYANAIDATLIKDKQIKFYRLAENRHPQVTRSERETGIERRGKVVHVRMTAIRSHFAPDNIEGVMVGDKVLFHVTNLEQDWDVPSGFAHMCANHADHTVWPWLIRSLRWTSIKPLSTTK